MSLGIGGATPFAMPSNHPTAFNHSFRDESSYRPELQVRMKCHFCGVWARKGHDCYLCHRPVGGHTGAPMSPRTGTSFTHATMSYQAPSPQQQRSRSREARPTSALHVRSSSSNSRAQQPLRGTTPRQYPNDNANTHSFRDISPFEAQNNMKVKCRSCGCWAIRAKPCSLCHTRN